MKLYDRLDTFLDKKPRLTFLIFSVLVLVAFVYCCFWIRITGYVGEAEMYNFKYADAIFNGIAPFTPYEDLRWEYPPLAYLTFLLPRLFTDDPYTYVFMFGFQIAVVCIIGVVLIMRIARRLERSAIPLLITYVASIFALNYFIFDRFDIVIAVLMISALYLYSEKRYGWAVFLIVLGTFIKLYPAVLLPVFIIPMLVERRYRDTGKQVALYLILSMLVMAPFIRWAPDNVWNFLTYHSDRGIQIESVVSSVLLMGELLGLTSVDWNFSFGSYNINGGLADALVPYMMPLMTVIIVISYVLFYLWCRNCEEGELEKGVIFASMLIVLFFIIFNKVFSAQYVVWITLPMIVCYAYFHGDKTKNMLAAVIFMNALTYVMVLTSSDLMNGQPIGIIILFTRNVLVIAMALALCRNICICQGVRD